MTVTLRPVDEVATRAAELVEGVSRRVREWWPNARVEHIGATALGAGVTKGDVDVNVRVMARDFEPAVRVLEAACDVAQRENWTTEFASFTERASNVGIQLTVMGSRTDFLVPVRDAMRADASLRSAYDAVKREAAALGADGYWRAKDAFLSRVIRDVYPLPASDVPMLETSRLVLRQTRIIDASDGARLRRLLEQQDEGKVLPWTLTLRGDGASIGGIGLHHVDGPNAQVGYDVERAHWGNGFATEALREIVRFARARGFERLDARIDPGNTRSERVAIANGFTLESKTPEDLVYVQRLR